MCKLFCIFTKKRHPVGCLVADDLVAVLRVVLVAVDFPPVLLHGLATAGGVLLCEEGCLVDMRETAVGFEQEVNEKNLDFHNLNPIKYCKYQQNTC